MVCRLRLHDSNFFKAVRAADTFIPNSSFLISNFQQLLIHFASHVPPCASGTYDIRKL